MSNLKISQLTGTTTNSIESWLIINNSGETVSNKSQLEYVLGMTKGSGTNSIKSNDFLTASGSTADGNNSISIGNGSDSTGESGIAIGQQSYAARERDIAIGLRANTDLGESQDGIAIGTDARVVRDYGIAIGYDSVALTDGIAIGRSTRPIGDNCTAIGASNVAAGNGGFSIGYNIFSDRTNAGAIGAVLYVDGENSIALGSTNDIGKSGGQCDNSVSIGSNNQILGGARNQINIGSNIISRSQGSIVISNQTVDLGSSANNAIFISATGNTVNTKVGAESVVVGGRNTINNPGDFILVLGGTGNTIDSSGISNSLIQSSNSNINGNVRRSLVLGSANSRISGDTGTQLSSLIGSDSGVIKNSGKSSIFNGLSNTITSCDASSIIASDFCELSGGTYFTIIGSKSSSIKTPSGTDERNSIIGALSGTILNTDSSVIWGGNRNTISGGSLGQILGGTQNTITGDTFNAEIIASDSCTIIDGDYNTILGSIGSSITDINSSRNVMIGGSGTTISSGSNQVPLGLIGRTTSVSDTTSVENIHYFRRISTEVQSMVSGVTFTGTTAVDWNLGGKAQITITGTSDVEFTNVRNGASFLLKTTTDGGHTINWSSTGYTFKWKGGDDTPSNNKTDLWRFEVFGTEIYGEKIADFS